MEEWEKRIWKKALKAPFTPSSIIGKVLGIGAALLIANSDYCKTTHPVKYVEIAQVEKEKIAENYVLPEYIKIKMTDSNNDGKYETILQYKDISYTWKIDEEGVPSALEEIVEK